ncbi:MAG: hypothetical protein IV086_06740 [Hyphomonadaceae bacterium]|nr:hypothetical protein [Hyphomonadaceae bacterium]
MAFALLALLLRILAPPGYMISSGGASGQKIAFTICSDFGMRQAVLDLGTGDVVDESGPGERNDNAPSSDAPCVFAGVAALASPVASGFAEPALRPHLAEPQRIASVSPGRGLAAPPPWPTGPPISI